jgi:hypothetical protein
MSRFNLMRQRVRGNGLPDSIDGRLRVKPRRPKANNNNEHPRTASPSSALTIILWCAKASPCSRTRRFEATSRSRDSAEFADAGGPRDKTLVRHVYDLDVVRSHYDPAAVIALATEIIRADVEAYGHQFPAYRENPVAETLRAVAALATDDRFAS